MNWKTFRFEFRLLPQPDEAARRLITIEALREAAANLILPPDWREQLDRLNRIRAIRGTTALEGNTMSEREISLELVAPAQGDSEGAGSIGKEQLQVRNAGIAQEWARNRFRPGVSPTTLDDILRLHELITKASDVANNTPGRFRRHEVTVGTDDMGGVHRGAPHEQLRTLMPELVEFVNSTKVRDLHPVIQALLAHFFLVTIHPFGDGNGRVSRLLEAGILFQGGYNVHGFYGLSNFFYRHEREYKTLLQASRQANPFDVTPFVSFGIDGFAAELQGINNFIKTKLNRLVYGAMLVRSHDKRVGARRRLLNQREYRLLDFLLKETEPVDPFSIPPSRSISWPELVDHHFIRAAYGEVTRRTLVRELSRLRDIGFIRFSQGNPESEPTVELDFDAVSKY
ncbi:MAG: Fic family protein [Acidobacteria bacterium]|nr:Fic family protein [Acidobacteriota bacterium]